jgi:hypothetical protein
MQMTLPPELPPSYDASMEARLKALEAVLPTLATKADVAELRGEMRTGFAEVRGEMRTGFAEVLGEMRAGFAELRGEMRNGFADVYTSMADHRADILRWTIATVIGLFVGFGGLFLAMSNALKPGVSPASQPIIINVPAPAGTAPGAR